MHIFFPKEPPLIMDSAAAFFISKRDCACLRIRDLLLAELSPREAEPIEELRCENWFRCLLLFEMLFSGIMILLLEENMPERKSGRRLSDFISKSDGFY